MDNYIITPGLRGLATHDQSKTNIDISIGRNDDHNSF